MAVFAEVHPQPGDDPDRSLGARAVRSCVAWAQVGTTYETPIIVARGQRIHRGSDGEDVNWCRNIVVAGDCELFVDGQWHRVSAIDHYQSEASETLSALRPTRASNAETACVQTAVYGLILWRTTPLRVSSVVMGASSEARRRVAPLWAPLGAAAWPHDIGYAEKLRQIGFRPGDGARNVG